MEMRTVGRGQRKGQVRNSARPPARGEEESHFGAPVCFSARPPVYPHPPVDFSILSHGKCLPVSLALESQTHL